MITILDQLLEKPIKSQIIRFPITNYYSSHTKTRVLEIYNLIVKHNCPEIPLETVTIEQTFLYDNKRYLLDNPELIMELHALMAQLHTNKTYKKTLTKQSTPLIGELEFKIQEYLREIPQDDYIDILKNKKSFILSKIIIKVLAFYLRNSLLKKQYEYTYFQSEISIALGKAIIDSVMFNLYIYKDINEFNERDFAIGDKNDVITFTERDNSELKNMYKKLRKLHDEKNTEKIETTYKFLFADPNIPISDVIDHLELYCLANNIEEENLERKDLLENEIRVRALVIGYKILLFLEHINIIENFVDNRQVPKVRFKSKLSIDIATSAFYVKPQLKLGLPNKYVSYHEEGQFKINLYNDTKRTPNRKYTHLRLKPEGEKLIDSYDKMPYRVNLTGYKSFIEILRAFLEEQDITKIAIYMDCIFNIDFNSLLKNNDNEGAIKLVFNIAKDFEYLDFTIPAHLVDNLSCKDLVNKINSYKFQISQIISDIEVLSHFQYFYLTHVVTSSGRIGTASNTVQMQGLKIIKTLIEFYR